MCGILGHITSVPINTNVFKQALDTLSSRGPDAEGTQEILLDGKQLLFGHRRLSIIDLSTAGNQPMFDEENEYTIVYNGEIYNFKNLKEDLEKKGYSFRSKSDTEVLLKGYIEYGQKVVEKLDGMFAFAIFDKKKKILTFARDHLGKKPFFYYYDNDRFVFASELKTIINFPEITKKITLDKTSVLKFLVYGYIPSPNSIFKQITKLEPATTFQFDLTKWEIKNKYCYWKLEDIKITENLSDADIMERLDLLVHNAVKKRLVSDVPVGIFLSGGIDSSIIAAVITEYSKDVNSFTVGYQGYSADETVFAKKVAEQFHIKPTIINFNENEIKKYFFEMFDYIDEPTADPAIVSMYFISRHSKNKISVVLSGDGGDEVFGGYYKYIAQKYIRHFKTSRKLIELLSNVMPTKNYRRVLEGLDLPFYGRQFFYGSGGFHPLEAMKLMKLRTLDYDEIFKEAKEYSLRFKQNDLVNLSLFLDCKIQIPDWYMTKGDRATMAASIEMRTPFLDKELVEFAFSLPGNKKIRGSETKYLLKKLASKYGISKNNIYRKKNGFAAPIEKWLIKSLKKEMRDILFDESDSLFDLQYVKDLYTAHITGSARNEFKLLRIFALKYYLKKYEQFKIRS